MSLKIYFAGPNVFHLDAKQMERDIDELCSTLGVTALIPGDSGIDWSNPNQTEIAKQIFEINRDHILNCDGIIANVTPFRGACVDDGTAWEIGFGAALNKPIFTYGSGYITTGETIESISGTDQSFSSPRRDSEQFLIEEFGLQNNLMIACSTKHSHCDFPVYENILRAVELPIKNMIEFFDQ